MILRRTQSLCPVCLRRLDAVYALVQNDPSCVELRKTCPDHGPFSVPVWRTPLPEAAESAVLSAAGAQGGASVPAFKSWSRPKSPSYPLRPGTAIDQGCPFDCGLCPAHAQHTCTGLVEVTLRCNMACPVCYASAGEAGTGTGNARAGIGKAGPGTGGDPDLACIASQMDALKTASGPCNVQISGGEPTVREDLPDIVRLARERAFGLVQVNTNGLRLAEQEGYAAQLRQAGLDSVYLQWDGVSEETFKTLRGRTCLDFKRRAVAACAKAGLGVVLVATFVRGVNDGEAGDLLRLALQLGPAVRGLHVQPAAFFG
ncbi:MAG: radical SAM protein, partial [Desulfovibrio sp.]|nr:radical SAM protein [Desulfovibrio sp.]